MQIFRPTHSDVQALFDIWLRSVQQTHTFLAEADVQALLPSVRNYLSRSDLDLWVLHDAQLGPIGFMTLLGPGVEALFVAPEHFRRGGGRMLLAHARYLKGPLHVEVNEQNSGAIRFYEANGFSITGRSPLDREGRPYPLLYMREIGSTIMLEEAALPDGRVRDMVQ